MPTPNSFLRVVEVHRLLKAGDRVNAGTIARRYEISSRSAQRVIEFMKDRFGAPVAYDPRRQTYYYADATFELPTTLFTRGEIIAIVFAYQSLLQQESLPLAADLAQGIQKLQGFMPEEISVNLTDMLDRVSFAPHPSRRVEAQILDTLQQALDGRRRVRMSYYAASRDEVTERAVDPYHLTHRRGDWYVVGHCHLRGDVRTFALGRIRDLRVDHATFAIPADFDAESYFQDALGIERSVAPCRVVLAFDAYESRWVRERVWHPGQIIEDQPDGGVRLTLHVGLTFELKQWILSYGRHVRVLEPPELAAAVAEEMRRALELY